ncbi:hypothetical protein EJ03DRAFT_346357 [Teratosphaeria nubilosa]|uniref:Zn(2)-C6 fungal-type domain-containing protein n=1 Tax=Teratosphaeria nubilosa TaxID=161662 RepID=A0A6G1KVP2_9PEZI|nr:hypothetical protein EJ03DRAFT_346357 [Teratosphaeria nubilosa]
MADEKTERASTEEKSLAQITNGTSQTAKSNAKDPNRPRRKKARRACFACQRAHLTCGDERPCLRCIKRGLQDQCHDGVRKKAKYLHDAPAEALMPGFAGGYHQNGAHNISALPRASSSLVTSMPTSQPGNFFSQNAQPTFPQYGPSTQSGHMGGPMMDGSNLDFNGQHVTTPTHYQSTSSQQVSPEQDITNTVDSSSTLQQGGTASFDAAFIDPNDPSLFNFNISDLNFGNHYGALEFGMLGHMSSGAVGTPEGEAMMNQSNNGAMSFDGSSGFQGSYGFNPSSSDWQNLSRQGSSTNLWASSTGHGMDAYAIGDHSHLGQSPHSDNLNPYGMSPETQFAQPDQQELLRQSISQAQQQQRKPSAFPSNSVDQARKRRRDTAAIYTSVQAPYSYTQGFHALTAFLNKRFPRDKVLRIARSLATIRPSFISCNQNLNHDDLIFMEKCFQRTLCEYEDFMAAYGTPTVICRRTGEIAAVNKEFSLVTGWRRDVLLGKEPNLNVNTGGPNHIPGNQTGTSSRGAATSRFPNVDADSGRPQPVFLAELLDEDSVVNFYEDFANLAFGASNSSIIGAHCSLLKYRTKDDPGWGPNDHLTDDGKRIKIDTRIRAEPLIRGHDGMNALGERDGRVDCTMCFTVKRDVFDIPMLIVMNFLPCI